jgi:thioredoxin 1
MLIITEQNFEEKIAKSDKLCVIDLYADWCGPCRMLAPTLAELEAEYPDVVFGKINVDEQPNLAAAFRVESIPLVAFVKENTYLDMSLGFVPKDSLVKLIEQYK